ncbi:MAG TPA: hypothetical protein VIY51_21995 [Xanthobacteraceae bacterium]
MTRLARMVTLASTLAILLPLAGCSDFDPQGIVDSIFEGQKKPLPGDRKPLFPEGTPGVQQGVPQDLVKGYQPPADGQAIANARPAPDLAKPKAKPKPEPKPKVVATPPANAPSAPAVATPAPTRPPPSQASPWPDSPPTRQSAAPGGAQTAWPDPPPITR